jgi:two-component system, response regulator
MTAARRRCAILVADDDEGDRYLIQKAMEDSGVDGDVQFLEDGQKLVDRLTAQVATQSGTANLPCLILLDLNMPRMDGREVLKVLKSHPDLKGIPVVVMTNSKRPEDVESTYKDGANSFFTKPLNYSGLVSLMSLIKTYWLQTARLPAREA